MPPLREAGVNYVLSGTGSTRKPVVSIPSNPEEDELWIGIGKSIVQGSLDKIDDRSKFMVTTVSALITANVGIFTFTSKFGVASAVPQLVLVSSAIAFAVALFPRLESLNPWTPSDTQRQFNHVLTFKYRCHTFGFVLLLLGLGLNAALLIFNL